MSLRHCQTRRLPDCRTARRMARRLKSINIQYSLRRERPSNSAYFFQTIKYHSIAPSLSCFVLNTMVQARRWQRQTRDTAIELLSLFGVEPLYKDKPDKVSNFSAPSFRTRFGSCLRHAGKRVNWPLRSESITLGRMTPVAIVSQAATGKSSSGFCRTLSHGCANMTTTSCSTAKAPPIPTPRPA